MHLTRRLWKLAADKPSKTRPASAASGSGGEGGDTADSGHLLARLEPVAPGTALDTDTLYLDEVDVRTDVPLRHALLEVALPPGAAVETGTWGIDLETGAGKSEPLERAQQQDTAQGYAVPVDVLAAGESIGLRHLVRFAQRGRFRLPPVRLHRMYDPDAKALDTSGAWAQVEVK